MSTRSIPKEFASLGGQLRRLELALHNLVQQPFGPGSQAEQDVANTSLNGDWGQVGLEVARRYTTHLAIAADHISASGTLIKTDRIVFAVHTTVRAAIEALAHVYWLYEPETSFEERVRRHINLRLRRAAETANLVSFATSSEVAGEHIVEKVRSSSHLLGEFPFVEPSRERGYWKPGRLGKPTPSITQLFRDVLLDDSYESHLGQFSYRYLSAIAHSGDHTFPIFALEAYDSGVEGVPTVEIGMSLESLGHAVGPLIVAAATTVERLRQYTGWDTAQWALVYSEVATAWRAALPRPAEPSH